MSLRAVIINNDSKNDDRDQKKGSVCEFFAHGWECGQRHNDALPAVPLGVLL
jgi:hypothetical protein